MLLAGMKPVCSISLTMPTWNQESIPITPGDKSCGATRTQKVAIADCSRIAISTARLGTGGLASKARTPNIIAEQANSNSERLVGSAGDLRVSALSERSAKNPVDEAR